MRVSTEHFSGRTAISTWYERKTLTQRWGEAEALCGGARSPPGRLSSRGRWCPSRRPACTAAEAMSTQKPAGCPGTSSLTLRLPWLVEVVSLLPASVDAAGPWKLHGALARFSSAVLVRSACRRSPWSTALWPWGAARSSHSSAYAAF